MDNADLTPIVSSRRLHCYAASFGDDVARDLIKLNTPDHGSLLDPWAGSGTGLVQARLMGLHCIGIDIDPVACLISRVALTSYRVDELDQLSAVVLEQTKFIASGLAAHDFDEVSWPLDTRFSLNGFEVIIPPIERVLFWFAPVQRAVLASLAGLARSFTDERLRNIVELAISSSIIRKWPNTISQAMDIDHSRPHRVLRPDLTVESQTEVFRRVFRDVIRNLKAINASPLQHTTGAQVIEGDAGLVLQGLVPASVDYVLTSPPYFNAIDYPRAHKFSQWWLWPERDTLGKENYLGLKHGGKDDSSVIECSTMIPSLIDEMDGLRQSSIASYRALCKYIVGLERVIAQLYKCLMSGGKVTFVVGNNAVRGYLIRVSDVVALLMERSGFASITVEERSIKANRRRYPYGITGFKGLMESEYLVNAIKP